MMISLELVRRWAQHMADYWRQVISTMLGVVQLAKQILRFAPPAQVNHGRLVRVVRARFAANVPQIKTVVVTIRLQRECSS